MECSSLISWIYLLYRRCTCFRRFLRPSSGAHNCTYSFRYCQPILLLAATVEMELRFISPTVVASNSIAWQYLKLYVQLRAPDDGRRNRLKHVEHYHHHKHPGLGHLARSVSRVKVALSIVSSVFQLFSFLVGCSGMILKGFGFVAFFVGLKASSFCIHLSCLVSSLYVVRGLWSRLFCGHKGCNLPEISITSFLLPQFFVSVSLSKSNFLIHTKI